MVPFRARATVSGGEDPAGAADLVVRIRVGDVNAENELVVRYRPGLMMLLRKRLKDASLADDYCQEVFRVAFQSLRQGQLSDPDKLAAYLWSIARNLATSELRRHRRVQVMTASDSIIEPGAQPEQQVLRDERALLVRQAVASLQPRDRSVLAEFYLEDMPKETICRRLGLSPSQFDVIKHRALKRLRALLTRHGGW